MITFALRLARGQSARRATESKRSLCRMSGAVRAAKAMGDNDSTLLSPDQLHAMLGNVKILDASWYIPPTERDPDAEFFAAHIPGALRFDIDRIADPESKLPHMLPSAEYFTENVQLLGISSSDSVCIYDASPFFTASARAWWMFRAMGHTGPIHLLDGGLSAWRDAGLKTTNEMDSTTPAVGSWSMDTDLVLNYDTVASLDRKLPMIDARPTKRYSGEANNRPGLASGHMPNSINVPHTELVGENGCMKEVAELQEVFARRGVSQDKVAGVTCGSGVTAAVVMLAMYRVGWRNVALYDGSWTEYGSNPNSTVVKGD